MRNASVERRIPLLASRLPLLLPDSGSQRIWSYHRISWLAMEGRREFGQVGQRSRHSPHRRGVRVREHLVAQRLIGGLVAPDLRPREEEALLRGEAVDRG